jgi:hypothetical protein
MVGKASANVQVEISHRRKQVEARLLPLARQWLRFLGHARRTHDLLYDFGVQVLICHEFIKGPIEFSLPVLVNCAILYDSIRTSQIPISFKPP